jgi:hypothetical protein
VREAHDRAVAAALGYLEQEAGDVRWGPPFVGDTAAHFLAVNRNKRSSSLDLGSPHGQKSAAELVANSDVLVEILATGYGAVRPWLPLTCGSATPAWCNARSLALARMARPWLGMTRACREWPGG